MAKERQTTEQRRGRVALLWRRGQRPDDIAKSMGLKENTVQQDIKDLREAWRRSALVDMNEVTGQVLDQIRDVAAEAWTAYFASLEPKVIKTTTLTPGSRSRMRQERRVERTVPSSGDSRYLGVIQKCIDQEMSIWGLSRADKARERMLELWVVDLAQRTGHPEEDIRQEIQLLVTEATAN